MKKLFVALSMCVIGAVTVCSMQDYVKAEEIEEEYIPEPRRYFRAVTSGHIKALVVRVGFKDYPLNNTNKNYIFYNDEYLKSLFEGKEGGFGTPYNGLSDYLNTSSYGKLSISVGNIIDIQMNENIDNYVDDSGYINFSENDEFIKKINKEINVSDYDLNNDGYVDALYIWNLGSEISSEIGGYVWGTYKENLRRFAFMQTPEEFKANEVFVLDTLIHETGHLLYMFDDYYALEGYPAEGRADIGNIMGWAGTGEMGDYDGWSKWIAKWLSNENVTYVKLADGDEGKITLTPYDSDTAEGKKIALIDFGDDYIAVDYCGGINNNGFNTNLRKKGFRFYRISQNDITSIVHDNDPTLAPDGIYFVPEEELGAYQLFTDGDEIVDLLPENELKSLRIFDINTGDNPELSYSFTDKTIIEKNPDVFKSLDYRVKIIDSKGNLLNESIKLSFYDVTETGFVTANPMGGSRCLVFVHDEDTNSTDTLLRLESVPEGYKKPSDIRLHAEAIDNYLFEVTSDSDNVLVSTDPIREGEYLITVLLEDGCDVEPTSQTEPTTEPVDITEESDVPITGSNEKNMSDSQKKKPVSSNKLHANSPVNPAQANKFVDNNVVTPATKMAPQTGDNSNIPLWLTIAGASAGVAATAIIAKKKKKI